MIYGQADSLKSAGQPQPGINPQPGPMGAAFPPVQQPEVPPTKQPGDMSAELDKLLEETNIAEKLDQEKLDEIGARVYEGYIEDLQSKSAWDRQVDEWVKLSAQVKEEKSYPWPKASNIKYPLLATAAMQFAARAYPSLVPANGKIVQFRVVGQDPQGAKAARADKLAKHMNYQLLEDMEDWEEEMDRLLIQLPVVGCLFKKTYFDPIRKRNVSKLVGPKDLVVNYWAASLAEAHRKTEIIAMTKNQIRAMKNAEIYLDVVLPDPRNQPALPEKADAHGNSPPSRVDDTFPYVILEQHTYWDLDEDGYQEPYIITIEEQSRKVLRIVARFDSDGIITDQSGDLICIEPVEYYTKYGFIPNPDGGFYDIGFGHLLGPINESANTVINQLVDSGTLANLQAGFLGKGLRTKLGETRFQPGEWKAVNATGDDIKKQIFPLPTKEPSEVLFKLLGLLLESGKELASVAEIFTGKMPGQNTPATTTQASIEQGMKVFTAIYKRTYRSLTKEFKKIFRLNSLYDENFEKARLILDENITKEEYDVRAYDVCPTADPMAVSTTQKEMKARALMEIIPLGTVNIMEVTKRVLEAQEQPNLEALMQQPQPQPDPKIIQAQIKAKETEQKMVNEKEMHGLDMKMKVFEMKMEQQQRQWEMQMDRMERMMDMQMSQQEAKNNANISAQEHTQSVAQASEQHQMKMTQMKEANAEKRKQGAGTGMAKSPGNSASKGSGSRTSK